jgi:hypothetical protein
VLKSAIDTDEATGEFHFWKSFLSESALSRNLFGTVNPLILQAFESSWRKEMANSLAARDIL